MFKNGVWRWAGGFFAAVIISLLFIFLFVLTPTPASKSNPSQVIDLPTSPTAVVPPSLSINSGAAEKIGDEYMALGDSVAFGVGASPPDQSGYTAVFFNQYLKQIRPRGLTYQNLAIPGETTASFISRSRAKSQLDKALAELDAAQQTGRRVSPITLTIGANDVLVSRNASDSIKQAALNSFDSNYQKILDELISHSQGQSDIIVTTYYNPFGLGPDTAWAQRFNEVINQRATDRKLKVADFYGPILGHEKELTWIASGDIHPNIQGYARLAGQIWQATGYANKQ